MKFKKIISFTLPKLIVCFIIFGIIVAPKNALEAAKNGFSIWSSILIPSLLPFIICAELVISLRVVDILGAIINPLTQLIFNVSGKSGLLFAISTVSGYPVGSKYTSKLRMENQISRYEAQRLASFCSTSGPLFVIGSVGTGMLHNPSTGYLILICHYAAAILVGIVFRSYGREKYSKKNSSVISDVKAVISKYENKDGFFVAFSEAITNGVNTLLTIGGFVIIFFVIFEILSFFNIIDAIAYFLSLFLSRFGLTPKIISAFISGLFEMTIGCSSLSQIDKISPYILIPAIAFLISLSGLSILAQCSSFLSKSDIKVSLYIFAKLLHAIFAAAISYLYLYITKAKMVFNDNFDIPIYSYYDTYIDNFTPILIFIAIFYLSIQLKKLIAA